MATTEQCKLFISQVAPLMKKIGNERGYNIVSAAIAQACIESAYGTSSLGYKYHNYFGMKAGKKWTGGVVNLKTKEEYKVGQLTTIVDGFRTYPTMEEGLKGYYDFIAATRYANLKTAKNFHEYSTFLKNDGYATSSSYISTLDTTVSKWGLDQYDTNAVATTTTLPSDNTVHSMVRRGMSGPDVTYLQLRLMVKGYTLGVADGKFGPMTEVAVKQFQHDNGLVEDGIVGIKTWKAIG